jgi:hypothetical protein
MGNRHLLAAEILVATDVSAEEEQAIVDCRRVGSRLMLVEVSVVEQPYHPRGDTIHVS